jgi:hypothetical protein
MSTLDQIERQLKQLKETQRDDASKKLGAFEGLLLEISTSLSDMVAALEKKADATNDDQGLIESIDALADAFKSIRIESPKVDVQVAAPEVSVNVPPPKIVNEINVAPSEIKLVDRPRIARWTVEHKYSGWNIESSVLTPVYEEENNV